MRIVVFIFFFLIPVACAAVYWVAASVCMGVFFRVSPLPTPSPSSGEGWVEGEHFVSLIKPVCGLEKNLHANLSTAVRQDYPDYEVIYSVQNPKDPALPLLEKIRSENPDKKIRIVVDETAVGPNGRLCNIYNASCRASGDILVFSDSDMFLNPDYLRSITAPFADPAVGVACTLYKAWKADNIPEALELLSFNADFVPSMVFAAVTGASLACPGASQAIRRDVLEKIGGLSPLSNYLVEDFELGRRVVEAGFRLQFVPYVAATGVDLGDFKSWWRHQVYWDQNTRAANPSGFFFTLLIRGVPFGVLYAILHGPAWPLVLAATLGLRLFTAAVNAGILRDKEGLQWLWLLPLRDLLGVPVWLASFIKKRTVWKGREFAIRKGKMVEIFDKPG